jgi:hypothetical protein
MSAATGLGTNPRKAGEEERASLVSPSLGSDFFERVVLDGPALQYLAAFR